MGPIQRIQAEVKHHLAEINEGLGIVMAPCCQVLPYTPNEHFKAWVEATHKYGKFPIIHESQLVFEGGG